MEQNAFFLAGKKGGGATYRNLAPRPYTYQGHFDLLMRCLGVGKA